MTPITEHQSAMPVRYGLPQRTILRSRPVWIIICLRWIFFNIAKITGNRQNHPEDYGYNPPTKFQRCHQFRKRTPPLLELPPLFSLPFFPIRSANLAYAFVAFGVIEEIIQFHKEAVLHPCAISSWSEKPHHLTAPRNPSRAKD